MVVQKRFFGTMAFLPCPLHAFLCLLLASGSPPINVGGLVDSEFLLSLLIGFPRLDLLLSLGASEHDKRGPEKPSLQPVAADRPKCGRSDLSTRWSQR
jgi:hypothetical protein